MVSRETTRSLPRTGAAASAIHRSELTGPHPPPAAIPVGAYKPASHTYPPPGQAGPAAEPGAIGSADARRNDDALPTAADPELTQSERPVHRVRPAHPRLQSTTGNGEPAPRPPGSGRVYVVGATTSGCGWHGRTPRRSTSPVSMRRTGRSSVPPSPKGSSPTTTASLRQGRSAHTQTISLFHVKHCTDSSVDGVATPASESTRGDPLRALPTDTTAARRCAC